MCTPRAGQEAVFCGYGGPSGWETGFEDGKRKESGDTEDDISTPIEIRKTAAALLVFLWNT